MIPKGLFCVNDGSACFKLSKDGKSCRYPISDHTVCKMVAEAKIFEGSSYANLTGDGHDLPFGCILETLPHPSADRSHWIYWNPMGVSISRDEHIRQICHSGKSRVFF